MSVFELGLIVLLAYLIGAIPSAVWIGKIFFKVDVRTQGSGNAGATNTIRVLGTKAGVIVLLLDILKGWVAVSLAQMFPIQMSEAYFDLFRIGLAAAAVFGHIFPVYAGFKGGKGVATLLGVAIALFPWQIVFIEVAVFAAIFISTRYVSLGSISVALTLPFLIVFASSASLPIMIFSGFIALFIPITHHKNIVRLLKGEENRLKFKK
ncbi:MAG: glycerol-3-phosphate 1-O-acyltransferase PlsY [Bacteroidales bacterium]|nr:glycerol-3-phosphate 1-O-acyltransferase PlsY [Bacteroidales bacterium]